MSDYPKNVPSPFEKKHYLHAKEERKRKSVQRTAIETFDIFLKFETIIIQSCEKSDANYSNCNIWYDTLSTRVAT